MRWLLASVLLIAPGIQENKAAEELFKATQDKIDQAKTLRAEYAISINSRGENVGRITGRIKTKGKDKWMIDLQISEGFRDKQEGLTLICDGRKIITASNSDKMTPGELDPGDVMAVLRESLGTSAIVLFFFIENGRRRGDAESRQKTKASDLKEGGKEKVGDREARVLEYGLKLEARHLNEDIKVKAFVDPETQRPLKRELTFSDVTLTENYDAFAIDEDIPDSEFSYQSKRRLANAQAQQLARSVELYGIFTGRHPRSLEDLVKRPAHLEADVFWPEGGFVMGGKIPKDPWGRAFELRVEKGRVSVVSWGADGKPGGKGDDEDAVAQVSAVTRRAIGVVSDRLQKYYSARLQLHLLYAAVRAYRESYAELPRKKAVLWERPDWAEVWPDGGWVALGRIPEDPWGEAYRLVSEKHSVHIMVNDPKSRLVTVKHLTAEEKKKLEELAQPRITDDEKKRLLELIDKLTEDDFDQREQAEEELRGWGPGVVPFLQQRLKNEKDSEVIGRLTKIVKSFPPRKPAWMTELASLSMFIGERDLGGNMVGNERNASASLKTIATAEADFRSNDRDNNRINDFWCADIRALYTGVKATYAADLKLIELGIAEADAAPSELSQPIPTAPGDPTAKSGYYYRMIEKDETGTTYADSTGHNNGKFGVCCYPAEYGSTGTRTFIMNETSTIFWKDTEGEPVTQYPSDEDISAEWHKMD